MSMRKSSLQAALFLTALSASPVISGTIENNYLSKELSIPTESYGKKLLGASATHSTRPSHGSNAKVSPEALHAQLSQKGYLNEDSKFVIKPLNLNQVRVEVYTTFPEAVFTHSGAYLSTITLEGHGKGDVNYFAIEQWRVEANVPKALKRFACFSADEIVQIQKGPTSNDCLRYPDNPGIPYPGIEELKESWIATTRVLSEIHKVDQSMTLTAPSTCFKVTRYDFFW